MLPYLPSIEAGALEDYVKSIYPTISISDRKLEPIVQTNASIQHVFIKNMLQNIFIWIRLMQDTFILDLSEAHSLHGGIQFILSWNDLKN